MTDLSQVSTGDLQAYKAGDLGSISTPGLMALKGLNSFSPPETQPAQGFFQRVQSDLGKRADTGQVLADKMVSGEKSPYVAYPEIYAQTIAGPVADIGNEAIKSADNLLGNVPSSIIGGAARLAGKLPSNMQGGGTIGERYPQIISQERAAHPELSDAADAIGTVGNAAMNLAPISKVGEVPSLMEDTSMQGTLARENPIVKLPPAPTSQAEFAEADKAYAALANSNTALTPQGVQNLVSKARVAADIDPQVQLAFPNSETGKLINGLQTIADSGQPVTIQTLHKLVKKISQQANSHFTQSLDEDGRDLLNIKDSILHAAQNPQPGDLTGGDGGFNAWQQANQFYTNGNRLEDIERVKQRALATKNPATSLQTGMRNLALNAKKTRGYSDEQLAALEKSGQTGEVGDVLHTFGSRLIPPMASAVGGAVGGVPGSILGGGLAQFGTSIARKGATAIQMKKVDALARALSDGSKFTPQDEELIKALKGEQ